MTTHDPYAIEPDGELVREPRVRAEPAALTPDEADLLLDAVRRDTNPKRARS